MTTRALKEASERYMSKPVKYVENQTGLIKRELDIRIEDKEVKARYFTYSDEVVEIHLLVGDTWEDVGELFDVFAGMCAEHLANL